MFESDFHELIDEYKKNKANDSHYIFKFIKENRDLSILDISAVTGHDPKLIRTYFKDLGIPIKGGGKNTKQREQGITTRIPDIEYPVNWRDKVWLDKATRVMGARKIARLVGVSLERVFQVIRQHGLTQNYKLRDNPRHQFKNHAWLHYHYNILHLSKKRCAELANISERTMNDWLSQFKIARRKIFMKVSQRLLWLEKYLNDLKVSGYFKYVKLYQYKIRLTLRDNRVIQLLFKRPDNVQLRPNDLLIRRSRFNPSTIPSILPTYTENDFDRRFSLHSGYSREIFEAAGQVEQHLALMQLATFINRHRFSPQAYPRDVISEALGNLSSLYEDLLAERDIYDNFFGGEHPIYKLSLNFQRPRYLNILTIKEEDVFSILLKLQDMKHLDVNYHGFMRAFLTSGRKLFRYDNLPTDPVCAAHLARFIANSKFKGRLIDLNPSVDHALAFDLARRPYIYQDNKCFDVAMCAGLYSIMKFKPQTMRQYRSDDVLLNIPYGLKNKNVKISVIDANEYNAYARDYMITGAEQVRSIVHSRKKIGKIILTFV